MSPLSELLTMRETRAASELLHLLEEGLGKTAAQSGAAAGAHKLLLDYFKLNQRASNASFASAFKKYPATLEALLALCEAQGQSEVVGLIQSVARGKPKPSGTFKQGLNAQADSLRALGGGDDTKKGIIAALEGFASAAFASESSEAEMELSLVWSSVEDALLDTLAPFAAELDFQWGPKESARRAQQLAAATALQNATASQLLQAFFTDTAPRVLAQASEWDRANAGATSAVFPVPVQHVAASQGLPLVWCDYLAAYPAAAQLLAVYRQMDGAALFCTDPNDTWTAGFLLLPSSQWEQSSADVVDWLTSVDFQDDVDALPAWVRTAIAFGKIPSDASYWILPIEGPFAGQVLVSNDDVSNETPRYGSFDLFIATLRVNAELVIGCGGYISYPHADEPSLSLYPEAYLGSGMGEKS